MRVLAIDTAFVSSDPRTTYEIGIAFCNTENPSDIRSMARYIKPINGVRFERSGFGPVVRSDGDSLVIGKTGEEVKVKCFPIEELILSVQNWIERVDVVCAHNVQTDLVRLNKICDLIGASRFEANWINTVTLFRDVFGFNKANLKTVKSTLGIESEKNSATDAEASLHVFINAFARAPEVLKRRLHNFGDIEDFKDIDDHRSWNAKTYIDVVLEVLECEGKIGMFDDALKELKLKSRVSDGIDISERIEIVKNSRIIMENLLRNIDGEIAEKIWIKKIEMMGYEYQSTPFEYSERFYKQRIVSDIDSPDNWIDESLIPTPKHTKTSRDLAFKEFIRQSMLAVFNANELRSVIDAAEIDTKHADLRRIENLHQILLDNAPTVVKNITRIADKTRLRNISDALGVPGFSRMTILQLREAIEAEILRKF